MNIGDKVKLSNSDVEYIITHINYSNPEYSEHLKQLQEINSLISECDHPAMRHRLMCCRYKLIATMPSPTIEAKLDNSDTRSKFKDKTTIGEAVIHPELYTMCVCKPKTEITNTVYELANDRLQTSDQAYKQLCKLFGLTENPTSNDIFRRYKQSGSGLANVVSHFENEYNKQHNTSVPSFEYDYDEG